MKSLFHSQRPKCSTAQSTVDAADGESPLARADRLLKQLRPGKSIQNRRKKYKPYKSSTSLKEIQKSLVLIDYQGEPSSEVVPFRDYEKLYDGCMRYRPDMSEQEIREEITRLLRQKQSLTHDLDCLTPEDFDFVRCANRRIRAIDGDAPFDGSGISQVYKNGAVYVWLNNNCIESIHGVSFLIDFR